MGLILQLAMPDTGGAASRSSALSCKQWAESAVCATLQPAHPTEAQMGTHRAQALHQLLNAATMTHTGLH